MTNEEEKLLLKDLAARVPYGVIVNVPIIDGSENKKLVSVINEDDGTSCVSVYSYEVRNYYNGELVSYEKTTYLLCDIKPYLRPMSSITKEEEKELGNFVATIMFASLNKDPLFQLTREALLGDFFNKHHIDYRGLIEMGLAIEAPVDMYKTK